MSHTRKVTRAATLLLGSATDQRRLGRRVLVREREDDRSLYRHLIHELSFNMPGAECAIESILPRLRLRLLPAGVALVQIDSLVDARGSRDEPDKARLRAEIRNLIGIVLADVPGSFVEEVSQSRLAAIIAARTSLLRSQQAELRQIADEIRRLTRSHCRQTLTIGVGTVSDSVAGLIESYREAKEALSYQIFLGGDRVIDWEGIAKSAESGEREGQLQMILVQQERKLRERVISGDRQGAFQALDVLLEMVKSQPGITPRAFKSHLLQTIVVSLRSAMRIGANVRLLSDRSVDYAEAILETDSYPALRALMQSLVDNVIDLAIGREKTPKSEVVLLAKKYIAENYAKSPSLREVANFVHLSPHYFSRVFAEENDCGFQDYLNKVRIEAAKDLLRNSPLKIRQAAHHAGFKDVSYFAKLFRRFEGMTPREFARSVGQLGS